MEENRYFETILKSEDTGKYTEAEILLARAYRYARENEWDNIVYDMALSWKVDTEDLWEVLQKAGINRVYVNGDVGVVHLAFFLGPDGWKIVNALPSVDGDVDAVTEAGFLIEHD